MDKNYLDLTGRIFNIQRFSVHDGPGIRSIVFLKGCPLRCRWCCNPESQSFKIETMIENGKEKTVGRDVSVREILDTIIRDMPYYRRSGGGMTLSGGEFSAQGEFSYALLKGAKDMGISTAVESAASVSFDVIEPMLSYIDVYMMDIKHMDPEKHKQFTSRDNKLILENAKKIAERANKLIIRVPVIPTFNDTEEEIFAIASFAKTLKGVEEIHLLPYHRLGYDKYIGLGREYLMGDVQTPSKEHMDKLKKSAECSGLRVVIGG